MSNENQSGTEIKAPEAKTFDENYVKELREEAARYRTQLREKEKALDNYTAKEKAEMEKNGEYKELLDAKEKEVSDLMKLADEAKLYRADYQAKLEETKKLMDKESLDLLAALPESLTVKARLDWAVKLSGKKPVLPVESRPGAADMESVEQVLTEFKKSDMRGRSRMLAQYSDTPAIYQRLLTA